MSDRSLIRRQIVGAFCSADAPPRGHLFAAAQRTVADRHAFETMATSMMSARTAAPAVSFRAASRGA